MSHREPDDMITDEQDIDHYPTDHSYFTDQTLDDNSKVDVTIAVPVDAMAELKVEDGPSSPGSFEKEDDQRSFGMKDWTYTRYDNDPWVAGVTEGFAVLQPVSLDPPVPDADLAEYTTSTDPSTAELRMAIEEVTAKIPTVSWESTASAMRACLQLMTPIERNNDVIAFAKECMYQVLHVMVGLNSIDGKPKSMSDLQDMWKEKMFDKFNACFHEGLSAAIRVMLRIGRVSTANELKQWHDWHKEYNRYGAWINSVEFLLDESRAAYRDRHSENPNSIYHAVVTAFNEEDGFNVLAKVLDCSIFEVLAPDKQMEREHLFHCKVARLLKRLCQKLECAMAEVTEQGGTVAEGKAEAVATAMERINALSQSAAEWLGQRLNTAPDKLSNRGKTMDVELLDVLADLMGPEQSINLAKGLLSVSSLGAQQAGLKLARQLRRHGGNTAAAFADLPRDFLEATTTRFSGAGDDLVKQLLSAQVVNKRAIVDTFDELDQLMDAAEDKIDVCQAWGELGLKCMCTNDERTRDIGIGLLESLNRRHFAHSAKLTAPAEAALDWLKQVCAFEGAELVKSLMTSTLSEADRVVNLLSTLFQVLTVTDSERTAEVPELWGSVALSCLRCTDKYPIREMGFVMVQEAVRMTKHMSYSGVTSSPLAFKSRLAKDLSTVLTSTVEEFLASIFSEKYCHHAVIRLVSSWLVLEYYREFCYEDDEVDLMKFLVDASVHDWGVVDAVTDLLVKVTVSNISIKSLNSLCNLFKEAVSDKTTATAGNKLVLTWIDKTRQKKWVMSVQERVLNLLWTMLVTKSSESEDDTEKVLDYFKNQFGNIRGHLTDWSFTGLTDKEITARNCIRQCAKDCLLEIRKSIGLEPSADGLTAEDVRSRATQSVLLLQIVLNLVDTLRPDVLREMHEGDEQGMLQCIFDELCESSKFDDVDQSAVFSRLQLLSALCSYLQPNSPLGPNWIGRIWTECAGRHRPVVLKWLHLVLAPDVAAEAPYFRSPGDAKKSRQLVLEFLSATVQHPDPAVSTLSPDGVECLLALFLWVNKDTGAFHEDPTSATAIGETEAFEVMGSELIAFDTLAVAGLDFPPEASKPAEYTLLQVAEAIHRAQLFRLKQHAFSAAGASTQGIDPALLTIDTESGLGRYDLLSAIFERLGRDVAAVQSAAGAGPDDATAAAASTQVNHCLSVLQQYLQRLAEFNGAVSHGHRSVGKPMTVMLLAGDSVRSIREVQAHSNMTLAQLQALTLKLVEDSGDSVSISLGDGEEAAAIAAAAAQSRAAGQLQYCLRPTVVSKAGALHFKEALKGAFLTLEELGVKPGDKLSLQEDLYAEPFNDEDLPSPCDTLATTTAFTDVLFTLLDVPATCEAAWATLQMVPTSHQALLRLNDTTSAPDSWGALLGSEEAFWSRVYTVQIVEGQMLPSERDSVDAQVEWRRAFVSHGGLQALFDMIEQRDLPSMSPFVRAASLGPLVRVVKYCVTNALVADEEQAAADADALPAAQRGGNPNLHRQFSDTSQRLVRDAVDLSVVIRAMFSVIRIGSAAQLMDGEVSAVSDAIETITVIVKNTDRATWETMCQAFPLEVLVGLLLDSPERRLREQVASTFHELISGADYVLVDLDGSLKQAEEVLGNLFMSKLEGLASLSDRAAEFFALFSRLVEGSWFEPQTLFTLLQDKLRSFSEPVMNTEVDSVLVGCLQTCAHLVKHKPELGQLPSTADFARFLFDVFLMRLPLTASSSTEVGFPSGAARSAEVTGPICSTEESREAVCLLLFALSAHDENAMVLASLVHDFASATEPPTDSILCRASEDLKAFARPGLHNNANRCYMNSLLQQLTSLSAFREEVLTVPVFPAPPREEEEGKDGAGDATAAEGGTWDCPVCTLQNDVSSVECAVCGTPKPENAKITAPGVDPEEARKAREAEAKERKDVLRQFQRTMRFLSNGEMQYYDAEPMLQAIGQSLSLMYPAEQQNDTKEFMDKLLEQLEIELSETPHKTLVKQSFGATQAERKTRLHDSKFVGRTTTTSTTFSLGLQVEGVGSVEEAMENYFEPQIREVDDEHDVDEAGKPIKYKFEYKTMFACLPSVLCVQLSRFSYDYSRGVPIKHNHRVEVPELLDMTKYVEPREDGSPAPQCVYRLKGYLIHMGATASSGHYYSIIRDGETLDGQSRWLKFDDNRVSEVKADEIDEECFGGEYQCQSKDVYGNTQLRTREKGWNAYLLFYELQTTDQVAAAGMLMTASAGAEEKPKEEPTDEEPAPAPETPEEAAARAVEEKAVLQAQEDEVRVANEKLWRRALLYQPAPLRTFRRLMSAKTEEGPSTPANQELRRLILRTGYMLFEKAVIHCEEVACLDGEVSAWGDKLLALLQDDAAASNEFFDALNRGSKMETEEGNAAAQAVSNSATDLDVDAIDLDGPTVAAKPTPAAKPSQPAEEEKLDPGQWPSSQLIPQSVLQVGCLRTVREIRDAAVRLIAGVATSLAQQDQLAASAFPQMMGKLLGATEQVVHDRDLLDGYVRLLLELADQPAVRPVLVNLDVPAFLGHIYMANLSPAPEYTGEDATAAATGSKLPKLPSNTRKTLVSMYATPLHDYKLLLQALCAVLRPTDTADVAASATAAAAAPTTATAAEAAAVAVGSGAAVLAVPTPVTAMPLSALPPLSQRVLWEQRLINRLVEKDPIAGIKPLPPKQTTPEEDDAALLAEGWARHQTPTGKYFWSNKKVKNSSTWDKPKPKRATVSELEDAALAQATPKDLLLVLLALAGPMLSAAVIDALVLGVERSYPSSKTLEHKIAVLTQLLLALDIEEARAERLLTVTTVLGERIASLRDNATNEVRALKNHQKCARMEVLVKATTHLQTVVPGFLEQLPVTFEWYSAWMEEFKPALRVTLADLQGKWRNSHDQDITIVGDQCSFADGPPVRIEMDESGTFSVPGWVLSQEKSYTGVVYWMSNQNRSETTSWVRPPSMSSVNSTGTYAQDDMDAVHYGPLPKSNANYQIL